MNREKLNNPFIALKHRNFRLYWLGMWVSLIGTWMQNIAQPWLAYSLTRSPLLLSLVGALQFTPVLLFSLFAGVVVDRFQRKKILFFTQTSFLLITLTLAVLVFTGRVRYGHILILASIMGVVNTLDMPTRQAFVVELVGQSDLMNAIALNSTVFNAARIAGPALAGIVMASLGMGFCFLANSLSFAAVIFSLFFIHPYTSPQVERPRSPVWKEIKDGLLFIRHTPILLSTVAAMTVVGIFGANYSVLVPVFTKQILQRGEAGFGFLLSFLGIGSLVGALAVAAQSRSGPKRSNLEYAPLCLALLLIITGITTRYLTAGLALALTGFFFVTFTSTVNTTLQVNTSEEYRGRVMSVYSLVFGGSAPLGNLFSGAVTENFGPRIGFIACGVMIFLIFASALFLRSSETGCSGGR